MTSATHKRHSRISLEGTQLHEVERIFLSTGTNLHINFEQCMVKTVLQIKLSKKCRRFVIILGIFGMLQAAILKCCRKAFSTKQLFEIIFIEKKQGLKTIKNTAILRQNHVVVFWECNSFTMTCFVKNETFTIS